jgi:hypothetical protein
MARHTDAAPRPMIHAPMRFDWTDEKLQTLSQEQLLNLLENLDRQRAIGRIAASEAAAIDQRIAALLTGRNGTKRRKQVAAMS